MKPPPNASPAPIVSTTSIFGAATIDSDFAVTIIAPSPPSVTSTTCGPSSSSVRAAATGSAPGSRYSRSSLETLTTCV